MRKDKYKMKTYNEKLFTILSDIIRCVMTNTVLEKPETRREPKVYVSLLNNWLDDYYHDKDYEKLQEALYGLTEEKFSNLLRLFLRQHDLIGGLKYLAESCGCDEKTIKEFQISYQIPILVDEEEIEEDEEEYVLRSEYTALEKRVQELEKLVKTLLKPQPKNSSFAPGNITKENVLKTKVRINDFKNNYRKEYTNILELLQNEPIDIENGITGGLNSLDAVLATNSKNLKPGSTFVCISVDGFRIDFFFN